MIGSISPTFILASFSSLPLLPLPPPSAPPLWSPLPLLPLPHPIFHPIQHHFHVTCVTEYLFQLALCQATYLQGIKSYTLVKSSQAHPQFVNVVCSVPQ